VSFSEHIWIPTQIPKNTLENRVRKNRPNARHKTPKFVPRKIPPNRHKKDSSRAYLPVC
jgi:hypothetical protein